MYYYLLFNRYPPVAPATVPAAPVVKAQGRTLDFGLTAGDSDLISGLAAGVLFSTGGVTLDSILTSGFTSGGTSTLEAAGLGTGGAS